MITLTWKKSIARLMLIMYCQEERDDAEESTFSERQKNIHRRTSIPLTVVSIVLLITLVKACFVKELIKK